MKHSLFKLSVVMFVLFSHRFIAMAGHDEMDQGGTAARIEFVSKICRQFIVIDEAKSSAFSKKVAEIKQSIGASDYEWAFRTTNDVESQALADAQPKTMELLCAQYVSILTEALNDRNPISLRVPK